MSEKITASVELIIIIPHNQFRFKYRINDGSYHFIRKDDTVSFFSKYISLENKPTLIDFVSRFRPFLIIPEEKNLYELTKTEEKKESKGSILDLSEKEAMNIKRSLENEETSEMVHNDTLLDRIHNRIIKK